jgi:hypothetical protein
MKIQFVYGREMVQSQKERSRPIQQTPTGNACGQLIGVESDAIVSDEQFPFTERTQCTTALMFVV